MLALLPVVTAVLIGWMTVRLARPLAGGGPGWAVVAFEISLGAGLGIGLTSALYFVLVLAGAASVVMVLSLDVALLLVLGIALWLRRGVTPEGQEYPGVAHGFRWNWLLALALAAATGLGIAAMRSMAESNPHGMWDAWAIWNVRARFLAGPGETWRFAISPLLEKTHPDYPLLLSGFIARCWKVAGNFDPVVPIATAYVFFGASLGLLVSALAWLRSVSAGLIAGLVLFTAGAYLGQLMTQYSDVPLAYYYLSALALASVAWSGDERRKWLLLALAGAFAALGAWTKNEGLLFLVVFAGCCGLAELLFAGVKKALARLPWLAVGMLPGLLLAGGLKLLLAPAADPVARAPLEGVARGAARGHRVWWVVRQMYLEALNFGSGITHPLIVLVVLAIALRFAVPRRNRGAVSLGVATLALVYAGYCAVSLAAYTPFERFYSQLWPAFLLVAFLALRPVEETFTPAAPRESQHPERGKKKKKRRP